MLQRLMCKGKIHRATVTEADLNYVGSISIDALLMKEACILPYEMVQVTNLRNAARWKTYALPAPEHSGKICLNGPPAHLFQPGDKVIILSMGLFHEEDWSTLRPQIVFVDEGNHILRTEQNNTLYSEENPH
jgi:aspartate 1-decarboxylase